MAHHLQERPGRLISADLGYIDFSSANNFTIQSFEPNHDLYSLQAGMELLGRGFFPKVGSSSSGVGGGFSPTSNQNLMVTAETVAATTTAANSWQTPNRMLVEDSSLRCLFPNVANQQPSQGLSLSLCNPEPSEAIVGMEQPFLHQHLRTNSRDELFPKSADLLQGRRLFPQSYQQPQQLKCSKFLIPAQELLNEFCSLGGGGYSSKHKSKINQWEEGGSSSNSSWNQSLYSLDVLELQKKKSKLLSMLEEVDRKYKKYQEQMRAIVSSFEAVAGEGAAAVYSTLASKAMSKHFRCLKDGILGQLWATKKAMGEKDPVAPGTTRGETPRLKLLDKCIRQQKAFQQAGMMESHPWRPQRGLPECSVSILRAWLFEHFLHPYPSDVDKHILARQTGLSRSQVSNWFINARVRLWKPMVEEMYLEETKEQDKETSHEENINDDNNSRPSELQSNRNPNPNSSSLQLHTEDQKPTPGQLLNDLDSLSSIFNSSHTNSKSSHPVSRAENFGVVDLDHFTSYGECSNQNFGGCVSLTLGLQQHNGRGMSLSFSPASQHSLLLSRDHQMEDCQPGQSSILEGEAQNLPYRNLMEAQLLHDLAG